MCLWGRAHVEDLGETRPLALAWLDPGLWGHLWSAAVDRRYLYFCNSFSNKWILIFLNKMNPINLCVPIQRMTQGSSEQHNHARQLWRWRKEQPQRVREESLEVTLDHRECLLLCLQAWNMWSWQLTAHWVKYTEGIAAVVGEISCCLSIVLVPENKALM